MGIAYFPKKGQEKIKAANFPITKLGLVFAGAIPQLDSLVGHGFLRKLEIAPTPSNGPGISGRTYEQWEAGTSVPEVDLKAAAEETKKFVESKDSEKVEEVEVELKSSIEIEETKEETKEIVSEEVKVEAEISSESTATSEEVKVESTEEVKSEEAKAEPKARKPRGNKA